MDVHICLWCFCVYSMLLSVILCMHVWFSCLIQFFSAMPRDWLIRTSPKWPVLCGVGCNSVNSICLICFHGWHLSKLVNWSAVKVLLLCVTCLLVSEPVRRSFSCGSQSVGIRPMQDLCGVLGVYSCRSCQDIAHVSDTEACMGLIKHWCSSGCSPSMLCYSSCFCQLFVWFI